MVLYRYLKIVFSSLSSKTERERERERERESLEALNPSQRDTRSQNSGNGRLVFALCSVLALAALLFLAACPAAGGGGASGGQPGPPSGVSRSYICVNGTPSARSDATADGISRCLRCSPIATLEGTSDTIGATCRPLAEVGGATRISAAMVSQFGVSEFLPTELAAIGTTLYMVGTINSRLYTLSTTDGRAIQVGSQAAGFGVGETFPKGLAAIGNILYMAGAVTDRLYTIDTANGTATQVGNLAAGFGIGETTPAGLAAIGPTLYMVGEDNDVLYTLNIDPDDGISDGSADQVGNTAAGFGVGETSPKGLAAIGTGLYMVGTINSRLYTLSTTDGRAIQVGSLAGAFGIGEGAPTGLAAIGTGLYMVGTRNVVLYALRYQ